MKNSNIEMHINVHEVLGFCTLAASLKGTKYRSWLLKQNTCIQQGSHNALKCPNLVSLWVYSQPVNNPTT